jgi:flavin-dependent dehydrogenase
MPRLQGDEPYQNFPEAPHRTIDAWGTIRVCRSSIASPWGSAWHVDRGRLDATLRQAARDAGVTVVEATVETAASTGGGFQVGARRLTVSCRELVDATGASARVARLLGVSRAVVDRQLVLFSRLGHALAEPALVVASVAHGWLYLTGAGEMTTQVAVVTDRDVLRRYGARAVLRGALTSVGLPAPADDPIAARIAGAPTQFVHGRHPVGFSAIGDAAWTPDPLSGHGVARALEAAVRLASGAPAAERSTARLALEHLRERSRFCASSPWAGAPYYQNRVRAYRRAREALHGHSVEMD